MSTNRYGERETAKRISNDQYSNYHPAYFILCGSNLYIIILKYVKIE